LRRLNRAVVIAAAAAILASATVIAGSAGAQSAPGPKDIHIIGGYEIASESVAASNNFDDAAKLAVKDLEKQGFNVNYERIPSSGLNASQQEQSFLQALAKKPDLFMSFSGSGVFIPIGPKVAATDLPTLALTSPSEGVKTGPSGGDNIFLVRPLNEQIYSKIFEFVCTDLKKQLKLKDVKIALNPVSSAFGATVEAVAGREVPKYKNCDVVTTQRNSTTATDLTQQVLAIKDSGANVVVQASLPGPSAVLVNQLAQNGVNVPVVGGGALNLAVGSGSIQNLSNLYAVDDCVPSFEKSKAAKKFVKDYMAAYGYEPNFASAQVYDMMHVLANDVKEVGHDYAKLNKKLAATKYDGVCHYTSDKNNVFAQSVTIYKYKGAADKTKVFVKTAPIDFVPNDELGAAPTTTVAPAG